MQQDIWKFIALIVTAAIVGNSVGLPILAMLVMTLVILGWQMYRLNLLTKWVINPHTDPLPYASGQFYLLHRELLRKNAKNRQNKRQLDTFLSQFRRATAALPDAIVLVSNAGKIEWANPNAKEVLGIRWPQDSQVRFSDLIRYPEVERLLRTPEPPELSVVVRSLSNNDQSINVKCVRYTKDQRLIIARDVSHFVKVNQRHTDFVANVSHELKTPLTVLSGYVEILQDTADLPEKFHNPLAQMSIQTLRMQLIVDDLLYLAKLEDSSTEKTHQAVDVSNMVTTILESVQPLIHEKHHEIELDIDDSLNMLGAQAELHSAFSNLITNAIHYTPQGGQIRLTWHASDSGAVFSVGDNGPGIAAHHLHRLTQRFYRIDTDRSRESGGTGLGLAIVKHILQRHDAKLEIKSSEGLGSEFKCVFAKHSIAHPAPAGGSE